MRVQTGEVVTSLAQLQDIDQLHVIEGAGEILAYLFSSIQRDSADA